MSPCLIVAITIITELRREDGSAGGCVCVYFYKGQYCVASHLEPELAVVDQTVYCISKFLGCVRRGSILSFTFMCICETALHGTPFGRGQQYFVLLLACNQQFDPGLCGLAQHSLC